MDTELKLLYYYSKYTKHVWIKSQLLFSTVPPNANIPAFKMFSCLLWENILPLGLLIPAAWQTSNRKIPISRRYRISFFLKSWRDKHNLSLHRHYFLAITAYMALVFWNSLRYTAGEQMVIRWKWSPILKTGIVLFRSPNLKETGSRSCQLPGWEGVEAGHAPSHRSCHQPCCSLNI